MVASSKAEEGPNDLGRQDTPRENMALHGVSGSGKALEFRVWT